MKHKRKFAGAALFVALALGTAEVALRLSGVIDFPLYDADTSIGYIPKPSQSGSFLRKNDWQFNAQSMGAGAYDGADTHDNLLLGDSIVLGGNPYREEDRLGQRLAAALGQPVWPASAGSWALLNQLAYVERHPQALQGAERVFFVLNAGDFGAASSWGCETTHPRSRPWLASVYVMRKYVWDWSPCSGPAEALRVPPKEWQAELARFFAHPAAQGKPVQFFLYPEREEAEGRKRIADGLEPFAAQILAVAGSRATVYSVGRDPRWGPTLYRDGIHPSIEGTQVLAQIIAAPAAETRLPR